LPRARERRRRRRRRRRKRRRRFASKILDSRRRGPWQVRINRERGVATHRLFDGA